MKNNNNNYYVFQIEITSRLLEHMEMGTIHTVSSLLGQDFAVFVVNGLAL